MIYLIGAFVFSFTLPILISSWRVGIMGLALQTVILAAVILSTNETYTLAIWVQLADLVIVRAIILPVVFISAIKKQSISSEFDFVPTNFIYWTAFFILIALGFWFGHLVFPQEFLSALQCGAAAGGILSSFLVLGLQPAGLGQIFAILLLESSIILMEFLSTQHHGFLIQIGVSSVFLALVFLMVIFIGNLTLLSSVDITEETKDII